MTVITDEQKNQLNKINVATQRAGLGKIIQELQTSAETKIENKTEDKKTITGTYTFVAADEKAKSKTLEFDNIINGYIVQIYRQGELLSNCIVTKDKKSLTITTNVEKEYVLTKNDIVNYIIF